MSFHAMVSTQMNQNDGILDNFLSPLAEISYAPSTGLQLVVDDFDKISISFVQGGRNADVPLSVIDDH
jgi:hypothetical protein